MGWKLGDWLDVNRLGGGGATLDTGLGNMGGEGRDWEEIDCLPEMGVVPRPGLLRLFLDLLDLELAAGRSSFVFDR